MLNNKTCKEVCLKTYNCMFKYRTDVNSGTQLIEEQVLFNPPAASLRIGITDAADKGSYPGLVVCSTSSGRLKALC